MARFMPRYRSRQTGTRSGTKGGDDGDRLPHHARRRDSAQRRDIGTLLDREIRSSIHAT